MSGGFFRGTSADQDTRFSNKQAKLMKSQKFAAELENLVDTSKVKMDVMRPWIAHRVTELLGFEDEVLINFIYGLLEEKLVNGKEIQISLTGFMEKNTGKFMKELWTHLLSAQKNASGVPQEFLDAKAEEARKKKVESDRITDEIQKKKEKEGRELEQERMKKMDGAALEPSSRQEARDSTARSVDEKDVSGRNGSRGRTRVSRSPHPADHSPASPRRKPSRSISKSPKSRNLVSGRLRSRSISVSPQPGRRSVSSGKVHRSPSRRSLTPHQRDSNKQSLSPPMRESSQLRRRSVSRSRRRSPSPVRRRLRSPMRRRSRSPMRRRSRSPMRRISRSPMRRRSRSPLRRKSRSPLRRRSRSPIRRRSRSPIRRRSRSPIRRRSRSPIRRRSRSPVRYRSRSPVRHGSRSPVQRRSRSPFPKSPSPVRRGSPSPGGSPSPTRLRSASLGQGRSLSPIGRESSSPVQRLSPSPIRRRSPSPVQQRQPSPVRLRSPSPVRRRSPSPLQRRSRSPMRRRYRGAPSSPRRRSPQLRRRPSMIRRRRSPSPGRRSPSPQKRTSQSPIHHAPGRRSPKRQRRSPLQSPRDSLRTIEKYSPGRPPAREKADRAVESSKGSVASERRPPVSAMSPQRDLGDRNGFRNKVPARSLSPLNSPSNSESPTAARKRSTIEDSRASSPESPVKQTRERVIHADSPSPLKVRNNKPIRDSPASVEYEEIHNAREEDKMSKSSGKRNVHLSTAEEQKLSVEKAHYKKEPSPERLATRRSGEVRSRADNNESKKGQKSKSDNIVGRASHPELTDKGSPRTFKGTLPNERVWKGNSGEEYKADERSRSCPNDTKGNARPDDLEKVSKLSRKTDGNDQSCSVDSGSEESDEQRAEFKEKRKHKRSKKKDVASDYDDSYDSRIEDKREAKRRRKEERRLKKEERRRRRAERRRRREDRHAEKQKVKSVGNSSSLSDSDKNHGGSDSEGERVAKKESRATNSDDAVSEQKKLEIELREKALQSLRAKKGADH